jgi:hypothetical protein
MKRYALLVLLALGTAGCLPGGYPIDSAYPANVSSSTPTYGGFTVGETYLTLDRISVWNSGDAYYLAAPQATGVFAHWDKRIDDLPAGTSVTIVAIRRWNTITNGYQFWPEAKVDVSCLKGRRFQVHDSLAVDGRPDDSLLRRKGG